MKNYLIMLVLVMGISLGGYAFAEHHEHADHPGHADHEAVVLQGTSEKKEVANKICPVDSEKIGSMGEAVKIEHDGAVYNLCCAACVLKFKEDPEKYAGIVKKELNEFQKESKSEDVSKICPICGPEEAMAGKDDISYEYEGKAYYFCSQDCLNAFKENPEKFVKKMGESMNKESHEGHGHKSHAENEDHTGHGH